MALPVKTDNLDGKTDKNKEMENLDGKISEKLLHLI